MNVIDQRGGKTVKFSEVEVGDMFEINGVVSIKIEPNDTQESQNSFNLNENQTEYINADDEVLKLNCTLLIEGNE
jgi:hypothetical protein